MAKTKILIILLSFVTISLSTTVSPLKAAFDNELNKLKSLLPESLLPVPDQNQTTCTCAVFLSDQFKKGSSEPPTGYPALLHEQDSMFPCTPFGSKQCTNKCLESIVKHLPNSPNILCGSLDRDVHKERAYLFIQNCKGDWVNTNLSAGREYCCKDGAPYKCPMK